MITTTDNVRDLDPNSVNNIGNCDCDNHKVHPINDFDNRYGQYLVPNSRNCPQNDDFRSPSPLSSNQFGDLLPCNDTDNDPSPNILPSPSSLNQFQLLATDFDPNIDIEFSIVHQGCTLYLYLLPILYYDIQYLVKCNHINTANCDCDNGIAEFTIVHHGCTLYLCIVTILY